MLVPAQESQGQPDTKQVVGASRTLDPKEQTPVIGSTLPQGLCTCCCFLQKCPSDPSCLVTEAHLDSHIQGGAPHCDVTCCSKNPLTDTPTEWLQPTSHQPISSLGGGCSLGQRVAWPDTLPPEGPQKGCCKQYWPEKGDPWLSSSAESFAE